MRNLSETLEKVFKTDSVRTKASKRAKNACKRTRYSLGFVAFCMKQGAMKIGRKLSFSEKLDEYRHQWREETES